MNLCFVLRLLPISIKNRFLTSNFFEFVHPSSEPCYICNFQLARSLASLHLIFRNNSAPSVWWLNHHQFSYSILEIMIGGVIFKGILFPGKRRLGRTYRLSCCVSDSLDSAAVLSLLNFLRKFFTSRTRNV